MKRFIEDFNNFDSISCEICLENFSPEKQAVMLKCSHTLCKGCLDSIKGTKKCPMCNFDLEIKEDENIDNINKKYWDNPIINDLVNFCQLINTDVDIFLSFPLKFKYCEICEQFITNYSYTFHKSYNHNLISFNKIQKLFFEFINNPNEYQDLYGIKSEENKRLLFLLYYYLNPSLPKIKNIYVKNSLLVCNKTFTFYGQMLIHSEIFFIKKIINNKENLEGKWHKGVLINNKDISIIIHGYFCIKIINNLEASLLPVIFGLLNYKEIKFFGIMRINNKKEKIEINDFIFEYGLLYDKKYYFGEFDKKYRENTVDDDEMNIKKLKKGEIITLKDDGVEIKRTPIKKENPNFIANNNKKIINQPINKPLKNSAKFPSIIDINEINEQLDGNNKYLERIEIKNSKSEYIFIIPPPYILEKNNYKNYPITKCKINILKYDINLVILSQTENYIYILNEPSSNQNYSIKNSNIKKGYYIEFDENYKYLLEIISNLTLDKIIEEINTPDNILNYLNELLNIEIKNCKIKYCLLVINDYNTIIRNEKKYFEFFNSGVKIINKTSKRNKEKINVNSKLQNAKIINLLPNLFHCNISDGFEYKIIDFPEDETDPSCCISI